MSASGSIFSGSSRYSTDFQQIINRSVAIASLPMTQLQSQKVALGDQSAALTALDAKFTSLQSLITTLGSATVSYNSLVSDSTVASASAGTGAFQGVYSLEVVALGSYTSVMSADALPAVTSPSTTSISLSDTFTLTVDGTEYDIAPEANTLTELANAINASGAEVEATIVNLGTSATPDYRLSVASTKLGNIPVQVNDGTVDLLDTPLTPGAPATYRVNGQPAVAIESDSRTVTIAPGLTVTLLKAGTTEITVSHNTSGVGSALTNIANAYNAAVDEIDKYHAEGSAGNALRGSSLLYVLSQSLRDLAAYSSGSGAISSLSSLGFGFDDQGKLSVDMTVFNSATTGQFEALSDFLGSSTTDGFLKYAGDLMTGLEDSTNGVIKTAISDVQAQLTQQESRITDEQTRIDALQKNLEARMAASDALIASMEQQVRFMNGLMESMLINQESAW